MCLDTLTSVELRRITGTGFSLVRRLRPWDARKPRYRPLFQETPPGGYLRRTWYWAETGILDIGSPPRRYYPAGFHIWRDAEAAWLYRKQWDGVGPKGDNPVMVEVQWADQLATGQERTDLGNPPKMFGKVIIAAGRQILQEMTMRNVKGELRLNKKRSGPQTRVDPICTRTYRGYEPEY